MTTAPLYTTRRFVMSCDTFHGFSMDVKIDYYEPMYPDSIVDSVVTHLKQILETYNLNELVSILHNKHYHIHGVNWDDIIDSSSTDPIYICSGCDV